MRNSGKYFIINYNKICISVFLHATFFSLYHYNIMENYFTKSVSPSQHILITGKTEDEQKPAMVSAYPSSKICQKYIGRTHLFQKRLIYHYVLGARGS